MLIILFYFSEKAETNTFCSGYRNSILVPLLSPVGFSKQRAELSFCSLSFAWDWQIDQDSAALIDFIWRKDVKFCVCLVLLSLLLTVSAGDFIGLWSRRMMKWRRAAIEPLARSGCVNDSGHNLFGFAKGKVLCMFENVG